MKELTIKEVQRKQDKLLHHEKRVEIYARPFLTLGEMAPALWRIEVIEPTLKNCPKDRDQRIRYLVSACLLQLFDYCNAKQIDVNDLLIEVIESLNKKRKQIIRGARVEGRAHE